MHLCPGNVVAIGRAVIYNARAAHTFSAGIKCRHCTLQFYCLFDINHSRENCEKRKC